MLPWSWKETVKINRIWLINNNSKKIKLRMYKTSKEYKWVTCQKIRVDLKKIRFLRVFLTAHSKSIVSKIEGCRYLVGQ